MCKCQQQQRRRQETQHQRTRPRRRRKERSSGTPQRTVRLNHYLTLLFIVSLVLNNPTVARSSSSTSSSTSSSSLLDPAKKITSSSSSPYNALRRRHTRLSGHGSSRHYYPRTTTAPLSSSWSSSIVPCLRLEETHQGLLVTQINHPGNNQDDENKNATTLLLARATNAANDPVVTIQQVSLQSINNDNKKQTTRNNNHTVAVHVEALVGVYTLPSGHVWVWIAQSKPVYTFPNATMVTTKTTEHKQHAPSPFPLLQIRKVEELYMVHVPFHDNDDDDDDASVNNKHNQNNPRLQQQQRQEQVRQYALWRQAWKDHDWYFCHKQHQCTSTAAAVVMPDMTRSMQAFFARNTATMATPPPTTTTFHNETNSLDKQANATIDTALPPPPPPPWYNSSSPLYPDSRFFWNEPVLVNALPWQNGNPACARLMEWAVPITSAFCGVQTNVTFLLQSSSSSSSSGRRPTTVSYDHVLISRRSRWRAGTRFTKRGSDAMGRVANYAETEQLILTTTTTANKNDNDNGTTTTTMTVQSHVQIRGSIPLRWSSPTDIKTYRPRVRIGTDPVAQARSLQLHLAEQFVHYVPKIVVTETDDRKGSTRNTTSKLASLVLVNLVDRKSDQGRLGQALDAVLDAVLDVYSQRPDPGLPSLNKQGVCHVWFDFHAELKGGRWDKLQSLLNDLQPALQQHGYFQTTRKKNGEWKVEQWQTGVVRTNCMDCLDRTNVVQGIIARRMLVTQLARSLPLSFKTIYRKNPLTLPWEEGEKAHRLLWADNADAISRLYAGTPALKGDFTRTGKRTRKGALDDGMNSLQRYYLNNFLDADRQEGIDLLTCHEEFNRLDELDEELESEFSGADSCVGGLNLRDAARELLLGVTWQDAMKKNMIDDESDHVRIKVYDKSKLDRRKKREFGLLWLPGDLQTQMRELISTPAADSIPDGLSSEHVLRAMDKRASSETPWWIQASSSSSDESDVGDTEARKLATESISSSPGFILAALVAAAQAPLSTAVFVLAVASASSALDNDFS